MSNLGTRFAADSCGPLSLPKRLSLSSPPAPLGGQVRGQGWPALRFRELTAVRVNDTLKGRDLALQRGRGRGAGRWAELSSGARVLPYKPPA